ncbi:MAG: DUF1573 domain-containing protein [Candidatus Zixiibacteriota bacterium]
MRKPSLMSGLLWLFILFAAMSAFGQKKEPSPAKISFSETLWDFGHVPKTGIVSHTYWIKNIGQDSLTIVKVRPTCGCTTTPLSQKSLGANESADMKIFFDPRKMVTGEATKKLQIISNDPVNPIAEVEFVAKLDSANSLVKLSPTEINFDTVAAGKEDSRNVSIQNISGEKLSMKVIEGPGENLDLQANSRMLKPGESIQIALRLRKGAVPGNLQTSLTLDFEGTKVNRVTIPIFGVIVSQ